jgi:hypothetical protein
MAEVRSEKISIVLTPRVLRDLDAYAKARRWSRSTAAAVLIERGLSDDGKGATE